MVILMEEEVKTYYAYIGFTICFLYSISVWLGILTEAEYKVFLIGVVLILYDISKLIWNYIQSKRKQGRKKRLH